MCESWTSNGTSDTLRTTTGSSREAIGFAHEAFERVSQELFSTDTATLLFQLVGKAEAAHKERSPRCLAYIPTSDSSAAAPI